MEIHGGGELTKYLLSLLLASPDPEYGFKLCSMSGKQMCTCLKLDSTSLFMETWDFNLKSVFALAKRMGEKKKSILAISSDYNKKIQMITDSNKIGMQKMPI